MTPILTPNLYVGLVWGCIASHCGASRKQVRPTLSVTSLPFGRDTQPMPHTTGPKSHSALLAWLQDRP